jgi:hypothetical protein
MFTLDYTVSIGNLLTTFTVVSSVIALLYSMKGDITVVKHDIRYLQSGLKSLTEAFTQLGKVLTQVAVQDQRLNMMEKRVDELAHGDGMVLKKLHGHT